MLVRPTSRTWVLWEIEDLQHPVDCTFCTIVPGYRTELTPEGEQLVIPGCEREATAANPQLPLF